MGQPQASRRFTVLRAPEVRLVPVGVCIALAWNGLCAVPVAHADSGTPSRGGPGSLLASPFLPSREHPILQPSQRLPLDALVDSETEAVAGGTSRSRYALPMLLSALVPGAGEISTGHWWNGLPLVAADVATWVGYAHFESEGDSWKDQYQRFADAHWAESRWQTNLEAASQQPPNPWDRYWDPSSPYNCNCSPPYIPKEEDLREYYENLGKYNHFYPGWEDWNLSYDPESPSSLRRQYVDMRIESNDNFDNAHALLGVAAATRIISVIQSFWLVRRESRREGLQLQPMTYGGFGSGLRLTWSF